MGLGAAGALGALLQHEQIKDLEDDTQAICAAVRNQNDIRKLNYYDLNILFNHVFCFISPYVDPIKFVGPSDRQHSIDPDND